MIDTGGGDTVEIPTPHDEERFPASMSSLVEVDLGGLSDQGRVRTNNEDHYLVARCERSLRTLLSNLPTNDVDHPISEVYYGLLYRKSGDAVVRAVCHRILCDEMRHIAFHTEFLRERLEAMPAWWRLLWRAQFWCCQRVTACVVAWDHRRCFAALGVRPLDVAGMAFKTGSRFLRRLSRAQTLWLARPAPVLRGAGRD